MRHGYGCRDAAESRSSSSRSRNHVQHETTNHIKSQRLNLKQETCSETTLSTNGKGNERDMFPIFCVNNNLQVSVKALKFKVVLLPCLVIDKSYPGFNAAKMSKIQVWKSEKH